jgi:hypothetical protein
MSQELVLLRGVTLFTLEEAADKLGCDPFTGEYPRCTRRREGWPCVLTTGHVGPHVTHDGYPWDTDDWRKRTHAPNS